MGIFIENVGYTFIFYQHIRYQVSKHGSIKLYKLSVNQESIFQTKRELTNLWLSTTKSYFKNNNFAVTDLKLLYKDTCKQFKAHQEQDGGKSHVLNFSTTERIVINANMHQQEMLRTIKFLKNLYKVKFKIKGTVQKNDTSNTYVQRNILSYKTTVASTDKNGSIILNINENT